LVKKRLLWGDDLTSGRDEGLGNEMQEERRLIVGSGDRVIREGEADGRSEGVRGRKDSLRSRREFPEGGGKTSLTKK